MRDRLIELLEEADAKVGEYIRENDHMDFVPTRAELHGVEADHLLANDVIVPPYRCGTVVYVVRSQTSNGKNLYMREERIDHYRTFDYGTFMIFESGRTSIKNDLWSTSVFTTHEEAKQALKGERT